MADGSLFPSSIGVNPMMTIIAMAARVARGLGGRIETAARRRPSLTVLSRRRYAAGPVEDGGVRRRRWGRWRVASPAQASAWPENDVPSSCIAIQPP